MTPFKTNQQLNTERIEKQEKQNAMDNYEMVKKQMNPQMHEPMLELKLNQPTMMPGMMGDANKIYGSQFGPMMPNQIYPSPYVPIPNPYYPIAGNPATPWQYTQNNVPIIKKYNISLGNGNGDLTKLASLYEDILPNEGNVQNNTFNTLKERMIIHHYIRSIFIKTGDGEELLINGGPNNTNSELTNLLSHVKLLEINPYHFNRLTDNPYKTLPSNFVMYRSCYPVKLGNFNNVECSKSSIGMNVRIYLLSKYDEQINSASGISRYYSDVWRELDYYQFVREEIIKQNMSPNFVSLHSYYMTKNTGINFKKFESIRGNLELKNKQIEKLNADIRNNAYVKQIKQNYIDDPNEKVTFDELIAYGIVPLNTQPYPISPKQREMAIEKRIDTLIANNKFGHYLESDKCLVMLSEAPTQHIFNWATRTYQVDNGPVKKMIQNGYHDDKVWESIFFQLLLSLLIMFEHKIMFTEFALKNNVYIKDLRHDGQNVGIWKYIYNGIEYYVPNYGYLLLIDSNFAEIQSNWNPLKKNYDPSKITFRIKSTLLSDSNMSGEIYKLCLEKMADSFRSNNFGREFTNYGGIAPTTNFLSALDAIVYKIETIKDTYFGTGATAFSVTQENKLKDDIKKLPIELTKSNFFNMVHSRIGTAIKDQEKMYLSDNFDHVNTKVGSIVVRKVSSTFNTFAIYLGPDNSTGITTHKILTTNEPIFSYEDRIGKRFIEMTVGQNELLNYFEQPKHSYEPGKQYNILETYLISLAKV
jgi:hypothetical protein